MALAAPGGAALAAGSFVPPSTNGGLEEITVTAQKRAENAQKAPLVVTSLSARALRAAHVTTAQDLQRVVPDLKVSVGAVTGDPAGASAVFAIRGLGNSSTSPQGSAGVAVHFDGIYRQDGISNSEFFDLQRIEVDPGPQGTLYGRSAAAGAVNVIPNRPGHVLAGSATIEVGNDGQLRSEGMFNLPVNDALALRGAFQTQNHDGFYSNGYDDLDAHSVRLQALYTPNADLSIRLFGGYTKIGGTGVGNVYVNGPSLPLLAAALPQSAGPNLRDDSIDQYCTIDGRLVDSCHQHVNVEKYGVHSEVEYKLGWGTLTLLPSFNEQHSVNGNSYAPAALSYYDQKLFDNLQTNLEIRLSDPGTTRLKWVAGLGLYHNDVTVDVFEHINVLLPPLPIFAPGFPPRPIGAAPGVASLNPTQLENTQQESYAAFGQATYPVLDRVRVTGGARFNYDRASYSGNLTSGTTNIYYLNGGLFPFSPNNPDLDTGRLHTEAQFRAVTFRAAVDADLSPTSLVYASVGTGYKPGGLNDGGPASVNTMDQLAGLAPTVMPPQTVQSLIQYEPRQLFGPERVTHYEIGSKNRFLENRLQINDSFFYDNYTSYQDGRTQAVNPIAFGALGFIVTNAGSAHVYGNEFSTSFKVTPNDILTASVNYLHGEFVDYLAKPFISQGVIQPAVDLSGKPLPDAPRWSGDVGYQHIFGLPDGGSVTASVFSHLTTSYWVDYAESPGTDQRGYTTTTLDLSWLSPKEHWEARGYVTNLEDHDIKTSGQTTAGYTGVTLAPPRLYGFSLTARF